ncbi:hypothetical protein MMIC_P0616 [Mariprofundus micogutta]|uniref:Uncharacterized protein n=1 Tax=Mariprofundus micogutta TaxID=1921010 RepID=A0A1L8CL97_9PROT|nr:hypothetical protein [Mariprofundus micogutta]GAV19665.1 hypothetical protein MMIC_P0616 [Mariprofundus micogutta]
MGIFPPGARWYLAAIAVVSLLSVAMHLSIQIRAQEQAENLIHQWGEEAGINIGSVRYHLLRNGLILKNVQLERQRDSLAIAHLFIHANPKLLTGENPKIGQVEIIGFDAVVWNPEQRAAWKDDQKLLRIWQATQSLTVSNASLTLYLKDKLTPPIKLDSLSMDLKIQKAVRNISARARLAGAPVQWQWSYHDKPEKQNKWSAKGEAEWRNVDSILLTNALGLVQTDGLLSGRTNWTINNNGSTSIQGKAELSDEPNTAPSHEINWSGNQIENEWKLDVAARDWPVQLWAKSLPSFAEKTLSHALLDADLRWIQKNNNWNLSTAQAKLSKVRYADSHQTENNRHDWTWDEINLKDVWLNFSSRKMHAASITTDHSLMIFQPHQHAVRPANSSHGNRHTGYWDISADKIDVSHMTLGLATSQGKLLLPELKGYCSWSLSDKINFNLRSMQQHDETVNNQDTTQPAEWRLNGQAHYKHGAVKKSEFRLRGNHIDLALLRPFIPLQGDSNRSMGLSGESDLNLSVSITDGLWRAHGKASAADVQISHAGDTWTAKRVETRFGPVGMELDSQQIDLFNANDWHYTTALKPLPGYLPATDRKADTPHSHISWWKKKLSTSNWEIGQLNWENGRVSIGNNDATWMEQLNIQINSIKPDHWASITADGRVGQGKASLNGHWYVLSDNQRFKGRVSIDNSLPFFLHDWMFASGMPRLVRGRISAQLNIKDGEAGNSYASLVKLKLARAVTETRVSPDDPMIERTGFSTQGLLERLSQSNDIISLNFENHGDWNTQPLDLHRLGLSMQRTLQQAATGNTTDAPDTKAKPVNTEAPIIGTRIRLREEGRLSLNERIRLRSALRDLKNRSGWTLDLVPKWTGKSIDAETIKRIRYTQKMIERFARYQSLPADMIYPTWPTPKDHANEIGSIQVTLTPPRHKL